MGYIGPCQRCGKKPANVDMLCECCNTDLELDYYKRLAEAAQALIQKAQDGHIDETGEFDDYTKEHELKVYNDLRKKQ